MLIVCPGNVLTPSTFTGRFLVFFFPKYYFIPFLVRKIILTDEAKVRKKIDNLQKSHQVNKKYDESFFFFFGLVFVF
jgi:hypothetical protein